MRICVTVGTVKGGLETYSIWELGKNVEVVLSNFTIHGNNLYLTNYIEECYIWHI